MTNDSDSGESEAIGTDENPEVALTDQEPEVALTDEEPEVEGFADIAPIGFNPNPLAGLVPIPGAGGGGGGLSHIGLPSPGGGKGGDTFKTAKPS